MSKSQQVSEILERFGWGKYNSRLFAVCGISWLSCMIWSGNISIGIKEAGSSWSLSNFERGILGTLYTLGLFLGSYTWGHLGNSKGRLRCLYFAHFGCIVTGVCYTLSLNYPMITFFAFWIGFFMGGVYVLAGALYSESSPKSKEWTLVLLTVCVAIGGVLVYLLAVIIVLVSSSDSLLWRLVAGCSCLIEVLCFFLLFLVFESPKFLMSRNDLEETRIVLKKIAEINKFQGEVLISLPENYDKINEDEIKIEVFSPKSIQELFSPSLKKTTLLITLVMFFCDLPWSALYAFMPILLSEIGAELESSLSIYLALLIQSFFCIPGTLLSTYLVTTRLGKKWTSVLGFTLTSFSVLFFLVSRSYLEVLISTCLMNFFDFIGFSSMMALVTESFPVELRSLGLGYSTAVLKFGGVISPVLIGLIFDQSNGIVLGVLLLCFFFLLISLFSSFLREPERKYSNLS